jgi:hypothetical protein
MPVACLALAGLVAFAAAWAARRVSNLVTVCYLLVLVALFLDLRLGVTAYRVARADQGNAAYAALSPLPRGRLLELPVLHPSINHGSLYLYYDIQAQRQRPGGYSTLAPKDAATLALRLEPLNCGEWRPGATTMLRRLGVDYVAFHGGLFPPGQGWFAWRALTSNGWGELARDGAIATLARGRPTTPPPVPEPSARIVFCPEWNGRSPRYRHGAFWIRGAGRLHLRLTSTAPDRTTVQVDGASASVRVVGHARLAVPLRGSGWHLVRIDVRRADRHVRLVEIEVSR